MVTLIGPLRLLIFISLLNLTGCSPTVNIYGVFVDPWIICGLFGIMLAYLTVRIFAQTSKTVELSESALLFTCLVILYSLVLWWVFYYRF
jgi:YtcA family